MSKFFLYRNRSFSADTLSVISFISFHILSLSLVVGSLLLSFGWLYIFRNSADLSVPGRGGALAVALAFGVLFTGRSREKEAYLLLSKKIPNLRTRIRKIDPVLTDVSNSKDVYEIKFGDFVAAQEFGLEVRNHDNFINNLSLAISSIVGTIVWGFGDWIITLC